MNEGQKELLRLVREMLEERVRSICDGIGNAKCSRAMSGTGSSSTAPAGIDIINDASSSDTNYGVVEVLAPGCCGTDTSLVVASEVADLAAPTPARCSMEGPSRDSIELGSASAPATVPTTPTATVDINPVLDAVAPSGGTLDREACLPRRPVAAPVFVASSPTNPIEYVLNTNNVHVAAVPLTTMGEFSAVLAPTAYTLTVQTQQLYNASEIFRPSSSQHITDSVLVHRPMPWPSFMGVHVDGDQTRPLPWPSFMEIVCCEFPNDAVEKATQWCSSDKSLAKSGAAIEFQILDSYGNLFKSTGYIIVHDMCIPGELRCLHEVSLFPQYWWSTSDGVQPWDREHQTDISDFTKCTMKLMAISLSWQYLSPAELKESDKFISLCLKLDSELERIPKLPFLSYFCYTTVNDLLSKVCDGWDFMTFNVSNSSSCPNTSVIHTSWICVAGQILLILHKPLPPAQDIFPKLLIGESSERCSCCVTRSLDLYTVISWTGSGSPPHVVLLSFCGKPHQTEYLLQRNAHAEATFWLDYFLIRSNKMLQAREFAHAHYSMGLRIVISVMSANFWNTYVSGLIICKVLPQKQYGILIHASELPEVKTRAVLLEKCSELSVVFSQNIVQMQIGWPLHTHACFITVSLSSFLDADVGSGSSVTGYFVWISEPEKKTSHVVIVKEYYGPKLRTEYQRELTGIEHMSMDVLGMFLRWIGIVIFSGRSTLLADAVITGLKQLNLNNGFAYTVVQYTDKCSIGISVPCCSIAISMFRYLVLSKLAICEVRLLSQQDMLQMLSACSPRVHAGIITIELSNEDNLSCCYQGRTGLFSFLAFDRQGVFQGGRCAVISIICYLVHDRYIGSLDYFGSDGHKVFHIPWDPGGLELLHSTTSTAWGQAVFQGGRGVRNPYLSTRAWDWAGIRTSIVGLDHLFVMGLAPLSATDDGNYKYGRHRNEEGIPEGSRRRTALALTFFFWLLIPFLSDSNPSLYLNPMN